MLDAVAAWMTYLTRLARPITVEGFAALAGDKIRVADQCATLARRASENPDHGRSLQGNLVRAGARVVP